MNATTPPTPSPNPSRLRALKIFLRLVGTSAACAWFAVIMPERCMDIVHRWAGLGALPHAPVVGYLARSASALYATLGGLLWVLSFDVIRHIGVLRYLGWAFLAFGIMITVVDVVQAMPRWWAIGEGSASLAIGAIILVLLRGSTKPGVDTNP